MKFPDSLEIEVSRAYWEDRGLRSFIRREVPNEITNNGVRAHQSAAVFFANCEEAVRQGMLAESINVVELGIGLGLFARLFLRRFQQLCRENARTYFDRLTYFATDCSAKNLAEVARCGTLEEFAAQVRLGWLDAIDPTNFRPTDGGDCVRLTASTQAILHNYLYDALPTSHLMRQNGRWYQLHLQTRLHDPNRVDGFDADAPEDFLRRVSVRDTETIRALARCYQWIGVERSFMPIAPDDVPHFDVATQFADEMLQPFVDASISGSENVRFWMPWGAIDSFNRSVPLLHDGGFMLFSDYGVSDLEEVLDSRSYQRYGAGICIGLNFPLLDRTFARHNELSIPDGDKTQPIHARLWVKPNLSDTRAAFQESFSAAAFDYIDEPVLRARELLKSDENSEAFARFAEALRRCDQNWIVAGEWAHCANRAGEPVEKVLDIARRAIAINPSCSPDLWNELGDTLLRDGRVEEAEDAFLRAVEIDAHHARSHYNLARTHEARKDFAAALRAIGTSLSCDEDGARTELLLKKQSELLNAHHQASKSMRRMIERRYF